MKYNKNTVDAIFKVYDEDRLNGKDINYFRMDIDFKKKLNIDYQLIKPIINDYYKQGLYQELCYGYAKEFQVNTFNSLIKDFEFKDKIK